MDEIVFIVQGLPCFLLMILIGVSIYLLFFSIHILLYAMEDNGTNSDIDSHLGLSENRVYSQL